MGSCRARIFAVTQHVIGNHRKILNKGKVQCNSHTSNFGSWVRRKLWGQQKRCRNLHDAKGSSQDGNNGKEKRGGMDPGSAV